MGSVIGLRPLSDGEFVCPSEYLFMRSSYHAHLSMVILNTDLICELQDIMDVKSPPIAFDASASSASKDSDDESDTPLPTDSNYVPAGN